MPNDISGSTDISNAITVTAGTSKNICIVGTAGTSPGKQPLTLFSIYSVLEASTNFGAGAPAVDLVNDCITNGVTTIFGMIAPPIDATLTTKALCYDAAFHELLKYPNIKIIIIDEIDQTVQVKLGTHLDLAEAEEVRRYAVVGVDDTSNSALVARATVLNNKRIFLPGPSPLDESGTKKSGTKMAAILASLISVETIDPALPMNGVNLAGIGGVDRTLLAADRTALVDGGVVPIVMDKWGKPSVYRLVTTRTTNGGEPEAVWKEGTTVMIADDVLEAVESRIRTNYKRTKNVARILKAMRTDVVDTLQVKNDYEIIENFDSASVTVVKDPLDVYGALVDYAFDVVTPLYTVTIRQHMKL